MEYVISLFWVSCEVIAYFLFQSSFLPLKRNKAQSIAIFLTVILLITVISNSEIEKVEIMLLGIGIFMIASWLVFEGKLFSYLLFSVLFFGFISVIDAVVLYGASTVYGVSVSEFIWKKFYYATVATVGKWVEVLLAWLLHQFWRSDSHGKYKNKWLLLSLLFPASSLAMLVVLFLNNQNNKDLSVIVVIYSLILGLANIGILYIINAIESAAEKEQNFNMLKQQIAVQADNFSALEQNYKIQRRATHEFEHHIQTLHELLAKGKSDTARDYISQLQKDRTLRIYCINTHQPVLDVILNQKYQVAKECGINVQIQINDLSSVKIQTDALVILFSNLLDNAIEACLHLAIRREIRCTILYDESLYISICNTSSPVKIENGVPSTDKPHSIDHGYGIPAIQYILEQLNAEYTFDYKDDWFQFVAEIPTSI